MERLKAAKEFLIAREKARIATGKSTSKSCLGDVRWALGQVGLKLPWRPWPANTALKCFELLVKDPKHYGWKAIHHDAKGKLETPCLVFFGDCGRLKDGRIAGHISILDGSKIYANETHSYYTWWRSRIKGAFLPG